MICRPADKWGGLMEGLSKDTRPQSVRRLWTRTWSWTTCDCDESSQCRNLTPGQPFLKCRVTETNWGFFRGAFSGLASAEPILTGPWNGWCLLMSPALGEFHCNSQLPTFQHPHKHFDFILFQGGSISFDQTCGNWSR